MRNKGFTFLEICDYLNTSQQVFGLFDKMNKRNIRLEKITQPKIYNFGIVNTFNKTLMEKL